MSSIAETSSNEIQYVAKSILEIRKNLCGKPNVMNDSDSVVNFRGMELALIKVGGFGFSGITNEITYFLPSAKKWCHLTSIPHVEQCNYGTAVLGNELYVVGGCYNVLLEENIHPFGFRYSPMTNKWTTIAPMLQDRCRFSLNLVGNHLYAIGGASENCDEYEEDSTGERYNPENDSWEYIAPLPGYRTRHAGAALDHYLYISGGMENFRVLSSFSRYNTKYGFWEQLPPMLSPRTDHVMLSIKNKIYVCGGWFENTQNESRIFNKTIDSYNCETREWENVTLIPTIRYHAGIVAVNTKIYIIGGFSALVMFDRATSTIECYDIETKKWSVVDRYPTKIWEHTCATLYIPKCRDDMEVIKDEKTTENS